MPLSGSLHAADLRLLEATARLGLPFQPFIRDTGGRQEATSRDDAVAGPFGTEIARGQPDRRLLRHARASAPINGPSESDGDAYGGGDDPRRRVSYRATDTGREPRRTPAGLEGTGAAAGLGRSDATAVSLNSSASFSVIAPPSSSASTIVKARR